jgi:hypothetical protein
VAGLVECFAESEACPRGNDISRTAVLLAGVLEMAVSAVLWSPSLEIRALGSYLTGGGFPLAPCLRCLVLGRADVGA